MKALMGRHSVLARIIVFVIITNFVLTSGPVGVYAADHLRPRASKKTAVANDLTSSFLVLRDGGVAKAQQAVTALIQTQDMDYMTAVRSTGTAKFFRVPKAGEFAWGHDGYQKLLENDMSLIAVNLLTIAQAPGHLRAAHEKGSAIIIEVARSQIGYALNEKQIVAYILETLQKYPELASVPIILHGDHTQYTQDLFEQKTILKKEYEKVHGAGTFKDSMPVEEIDDAVVKSVQMILTENIRKEREAVLGIVERLIKAGFTSIAIDASTLFDEVAGDAVMDYYAQNGNKIEQLVIKLEKEFALPLEWGADFLRYNPDTQQNEFTRISSAAVKEMKDRNRPQDEIDTKVKEMTAAFGALYKEALAAGFNPKVTVIEYDRIMTEIAQATIAGNIPKKIYDQMSDQERLLLLPSSNAQETAYQLKMIDELLKIHNPALLGHMGKEIEVGHVDRKAPNPRRGNKMEAKLTHPAAVKVMGEYLKNQGLEFDLIATNNGSGHGTEFDKKTLTPVSQVGKISPDLTVELQREAKAVKASIAQHGTSGSDMQELAVLSKSGVLKFNIATNYQQIILNAAALIDDGLAGDALMARIKKDMGVLTVGLSEHTRTKIQDIAARFQAKPSAAALSPSDTVFMKFLKITYAWGMKKGKIKDTSSKEEIATLLAKEFKRSFKDMDKSLYDLGNEGTEESLLEISGLPILLNTANGELSLGSDIVSEPRWERPLSDLDPSNESPEAIKKDPSRLVYYGYRNVGLSADLKAISDNGLRYDITVLLPGMIDGQLDREFIMTKGHQHPTLGKFVYPEIYEVWNGKALYVQQGVNPKTKKFEVLATFAEEGDKVVLLPNYSHRTVNIGDVPLVMANWISREVGGVAADPESIKVKPNFADIEAKRGYAYRVKMDQNGKVDLDHNYNYGAKEVPLRLAVAARAVPSVGLVRSLPMYDLIHDPAQAGTLNAFLTHAQKFDKVFTDAFDEISKREAQLTYNVKDGGETVLLANPLNIKKIGILTQGGPAPGHNNGIYSVKLETDAYGIELIGIFEGFKGLIKDDLVNKARPLTLAELEAERFNGGTTVLFTGRENPYSDDNIAKNIPQKMWENIKKLELDALIVLGGDDSQSVAYKLRLDHPEFPIIGGAKTMDNDIALTNPKAPTYGFDTFVRASIDLAKRALVDYKSTKRIGVVEIFGRKAGFVTAKVGAAINAARSLIPEEKIDLDQLIKDVKAYQDRFGYGIVIVSEGIVIEKPKTDPNDPTKVIETDPRILKNAEILKAALAKDDRATAAYEGKNVEFDKFKNPKLQDSAAIINAVLKYGKVSTSLTGKFDYAVRSAPISDADLKMTSLIGQAAVRKIVQGVKNELLFVDTLDIDTMQVEAMEFTAKLGGRTMDIRKDVGEDWAVYKQANQSMGMGKDGGAEVAAPQQYFTDVVELYKAMRRADWYQKLVEQPDRILLNQEQMNAVIWKLGAFTATEDWMWIRRIVRKISPEQVDQLKAMAQEKGLDKAMDLALKDINGFILAGNALIFRAGAFNMFLENWEAGVNIVGIKGLKGKKEINAKDFVNHNSYYNKVFNRYKAAGLRMFPDKPVDIGGLKTPELRIPPDRNIGRPLMTIPFFEASVTKEQEAAGIGSYDSDSILAAYEKAGISIDVMYDYGPGGEEGGLLQAKRLTPFAKKKIPMVLASPVHKDGVKAMLKEQGYTNNNAFVEALYSFNRGMVTDEVWAVDTLTCTSNAMLSIIMALATNEAIDIQNFFGRTWHSATSSNSIFSEPSGRARQLIDWLRGISVLDNFIPGGTGAAKNLDVIIQSLLKGGLEERSMGERIEDLKDKAMIDAVRTGTFAGSSYEIVFALNKAITKEQLVAILKNFAHNVSDDVVQYYEGIPGESDTPLDLNKIVGMPQISIVDGLQLKISPDGKMIVITGWYDNQAAAPGQMPTRWGPRIVDARRAKEAIASRPAALVDGGVTPAMAQPVSAKVVQADLVKTVLDSDRSVYNVGSMNFGNIVKSVSEIQNAKGAVIIGANAIFENAGSISALQRAKDAAGVVNFAIWAKDETAKKTLEALGVDKYATIHIGLQKALDALKDAKMPQDKIALISSDLDMDNIKAEFVLPDAAAFFNKMKVKNVYVASARTGLVNKRINAMPLVMAKALAMIFNNESAVKLQLQNLANAYMKDGLITASDMASITQLTDQLADIPLVSVSNEVAAMQTTFEETLNKI